MTTGPNLRLDNLGSRIDEARRRHERGVVSEPPPRQPLTTVFDDWNEDIRARNKISGQLSIEQRVAAVAILSTFAALLIWW
jgi:hypothetical protein